jgi:putative transposase
VVQKTRFERGQKKLGHAGFCKELTASRNSKKTPWLKDEPVRPQQQVLKDPDRAYTNFFARRADFPRFRRKGNPTASAILTRSESSSMRPTAVSFLPKLGWLRYRNSRDVLGDVRKVTVSQHADKSGSSASRPNVQSSIRCIRPVR